MDIGGQRDEAFRQRQLGLTEILYQHHRSTIVELSTIPMIFFIGEDGDYVVAMPIRVNAGFEECGSVLRWENVSTRE